MLKTLNLAPLDEPVIMVPKNKIVPKNETTTECNTIVMIFIGSVLFLALMDSMK